jgi:hypothetical protein
MFQLWRIFDILSPFILLYFSKGDLISLRRCLGRSGKIVIPGLRRKLIIIEGPCYICKTNRKKLEKFLPGKQCWNCARKILYPCEDCHIFNSLLNSRMDFKIGINSISDWNLTNIGIFCRDNCRGKICKRCLQTWNDCNCKAILLVHSLSANLAHSYLGVFQRKSGSPMFTCREVGNYSSVGYKELFKQFLIDG